MRSLFMMALLPPVIHPWEDVIEVNAQAAQVLRFGRLYQTPHELFQVKINDLDPLGFPEIGFQLRRMILDGVGSRLSLLLGGERASARRGVFQNLQEDALVPVAQSTSQVEERPRA